MNANIEVQLMTTTPLHITAPEKNARYNIETGKVSYSQTGTFPLTSVRKMALAEKSGDGRLSIPLLPSGTIRGKLRRCIADLYFQSAISRKATLSLDAFHSMTSGAAHGHPDQFTSIEDIQRYLNNPYFGLMGGGPKIGYTSQLRVKNGLPVCPATMDTTRVPLIKSKLLGELDAIDTDWITDIIPNLRKDDACSSKIVPIANKVVENIEKAIADHEAALRGDKKQKEDSDESSRGLTSFSFIETIIPKIPFFLSFEAINSNETSIGILLLGLQQMFQQPIGGKAAVGMGDVAVTNIAVKIDDTVSRPTNTAPETWDSWFAEDGVVGTCIQAAQEEISGFDIGELEDLCHPAHVGKKKAS